MTKVQYASVCIQLLSRDVCLCMRMKCVGVCAGRTTAMHLLEAYA